MVTQATYTRYPRIFLLLALMLCSQWAMAKAEARLDRPVIRMNETVNLTVSIDATSIFGKPDIAVIQNNFDILGSNQNSQTHWVNGKKTALTEWRYEIAPKQAGVFTIPAIEVNGEKTQPITLQVQANSNNPAASSEPVFLEVFADRNSAYVQEQILLTIRINSSIPVRDLQLETQLALKDVLQHELGNNQYRRTINNTAYTSHELRVALFPQASGELTIPIVQALAIAPSTNNRRQDTFGRLFNQGKKIRLRSEPFTIKVHEIPAQNRGKEWLPAKQVALTETWSADPEQIQLGDSITRTINLKALGLAAEQLPPVTMAVSKHFKTYPDQPKLNNEKTMDGIVGTRTDSIALVATKPGNITLPAVTVSWWDVNSQTQKTATLPATTLYVHGELPTATSSTATLPQTPQATATSSTNTMPVAKQSSQNLVIWQIATAISTTTMLLFAVLWWRKDTSSATHTSDNTAETAQATQEQALKHLKIACQNQNPAGIRTAMINWATLHWPQQRIHSTMDISRLLGNPDLTAQIKQLDAALYTGQQNVDWNTLYQLIAQEGEQRTTKGEALKPLYPSH